VARAFRRKGDHFVAKFDEMERRVVADLMEQTREIVAPVETPERVSTGDAFDDIVAGLGVSVAAGDQDPLEDPSQRDPALDRLLPTAHRGDEEVAAEFRRLTETGLRQRKAAALDTAADLLRGDDKVRLDAGQARELLKALTDVRLVLGERMGLRTDHDVDVLEAAAADLDPDDPLGYALAVYDFLTWLQETLASAMLDG
jgi:uncharacterized protein DUF2017